MGLQFLMDMENNKAVKKDRGKFEEVKQKVVRRCTEIYKDLKKQETKHEVKKIDKSCT